MGWWRLDLTGDDVNGDPVLDAVDQASEALAKARQTRGLPAWDERAHARAAAALVREGAKHYTLPAGGRLVAVRSLCRDGRTFVTAIDGAELEASDRAALEKLPRAIARAYLDGGPERLPRARELVHALGGLGRDEESLMPRLAPIVEGAAPDAAGSFRLRHDDGRVWSASIEGATRRIRMLLPGEAEVIERVATFRDERTCQGETAALVEEQHAEGFVDDRIEAFALSRAGEGRTSADRSHVDVFAGTFAVVDGFPDARAATLALDAITTTLRARDALNEDALRAALSAADLRLAEANRAAGSAMGATAALVQVRGARVLAARVPFDRVYRWRRDALELMTPDAWSSPELEAAARPLGTGDAQIEIHGWDLEAGDVLVLSTDGVHRLADQAALAQRTHDAAPGGAEQIALGWLALGERSDDRTVVVVTG